MKLPFIKPKVEHRQGVYTDAIIASILQQATGEQQADVLTTGPLEIAAGVIARAFMSASITGASIPPAVVGNMARGIITRGEAVAVYDGVELREVSHWEVMGDSWADTWRYRVQMDTPSGRSNESVFGRRYVVHAMYSYDAGRPWVGVGPLQRAALSGQLSANLESSLRDETGGAVGYLLPIPTDGNDASVTSLKNDITKLGGKTAVVETTAAGWGEGRASAPRQDYVPQRIGYNPPQVTPQIYSAVHATVLAICGVPVELVTASDGTGQREAWRRCLHGTIEPLSRILETEMSRVYGRDVSMNFDSLFASDISGRARAFQSLVGGGMSIQEAASASGLLGSE